MDWAETPRSATFADQERQATRRAAETRWTLPNRLLRRPASEGSRDRGHPDARRSDLPLAGLLGAAEQLWELRGQLRAGSTGRAVPMPHSLGGTS